MIALTLSTHDVYTHFTLFCSVVVMLCGGNIDTTVLGRCLERGLAADGRMIRFCVRLPDKPGSLGKLTHLLEELNVR